MKKPFLLFLVATFLLLSNASIAQSASTGNPLYQHLPPTANHIYQLNFNQINTKGNLSAVLGSIPTKDQKTALIFSILQDPGAAGVNLDQNIFFTQTTAEGTGADTLSFSNILVALKDSAKFRAALTGAIEGLHVHRLPGKGATASKDRLSFAWNDKVVVLTLVSIEHDATKGSISATPGVHRPLSEIATEKSLAALAGFPASPLMTDQRFLTAFATNEDIHAWSTRMDMMRMLSKLGSKMAAKNPAMQGKPMPDYSKMGQMPRPPVLTTFNFDNGRIILRSTFFYGADDAALIQSAYDRPVNKDLLARVPNNGLLLGFVGMHINPTAFPQMLDKYHTRQLVDSMLGKKGLSVNDISGVLGGDFLVAVLGDTTAATDAGKKKLNFYFVATLGDPAKLMQLTGKLMAAGKTTPDTAAAGKMKKIADKIVVKDNILVVSTTHEMAQQYFANTDRRSTALAGADNSPMHAVIDLKAVGAFLAQSMTNDPKAILAARVLQRLDRIDFSNAMMDGNNMTMTFQIVTGDPSTNSLQTLMGLMH